MSENVLLSDLALDELDELTELAEPKLELELELRDLRDLRDDLADAICNNRQVDFTTRTVLLS